MSAPKVELLMFKRGGKAVRKRLTVEEITMKDNSERETFLLGQEAVPVRYNGLFGFPKRSRMYMAVEGISDVIPQELIELDARGKPIGKRTTQEEFEELEDRWIFREIQKAKSGPVVPFYIAALLPSIGVLSVTAAVISIFWLAQIQGWF